jgi:hypothetical protein
LLDVSARPSPHFILHQKSQHVIQYFVISTPDLTFYLKHPSLTTRSEKRYRSTFCTSAPPRHTRCERLATSISYRAPTSHLYIYIFTPCPTHLYLHLQATPALFASLRTLFLHSLPPVSYQHRSQPHAYSCCACTYYEHCRSTDTFLERVTTEARD